MGTTYTLYFSPGACSRVAMTALEAANAVYDARLVRLGEGEQLRESFLIQNPKGKVPVLVTAEGVLTELPAIAQYLHAKFPDAGLLSDGSEMDRATSLAWMAWCSSTLHPVLYRIRMPHRIHPDAAQHGLIRQAAAAELTGQLQVACRPLSKGDWLMGQQWCLADAYLYWVIERALASNANVVLGPDIQAWRERCADWPAWMRAIRREA